MKVTVSCAGRFHAFELVRQLERRRALQRFITTTVNGKLIPNRALPEELRSDQDFQERVVQIPLPEYLCYGLRKLPLGDAQSLAYLAKDNLFDRQAVKHVPRSDIFVGWANQSLFQLREAKTRGARTIIERGSAHIEAQYRLIEEEQHKFGARTSSRSSFDKLLIEKQLKEYHETDYIMVPSEFARQSFIARGFRESQILKAAYGVDLAGFYPAASLARRVGPITILFVGAIGFQKGVPYLLEAVRELRKEHLIKLKLIGKFESDFAEYAKRSGLSSEIDEHVDFVSHSELVDHFHDADIFCLPSVQEGLALVIAEALASGLPVVATHNTGAEEFGVSPAIQLVEAANSEPLQKALARWIGDRDALEQASSEAPLLASQFSWDRYGEEIYQIYQSILSKPHETKSTGEEITEYYDEYWNREKGWTPSHSFSDDQLALHFGGAFAKTDEVLDVGCGDASNYQSWLVGQVKHLAAIDLSPSGIAQARRMGLDAKVHDLSKPFPYSDDSFDGATCIEVLEHLYDPKFAVEEMLRVLKPGGLLVTSVPNNGYFRERLKALFRAEMSTSITDFENEWKGAHIRFYSLYSFRRMFEVAGFHVESIRSNGDSSVFDGFDAIGGYWTQHITTTLRRKLPRLLRLAFLEDIWPSAFAPHLIVRARKPREHINYSR